MKIIYYYLYLQYLQISKVCSELSNIVVLYREKLFLTYEDLILMLLQRASIRFIFTIRYEEIYGLIKRA